MKDLPRTARLYVLVIFGLGLFAVFISLPLLARELALIPLLILLVVLEGVLDLFPIRLLTSEPHNSLEITISVAVRMAAILLVPLPVVIVSSFGGTLLAEVLVRRAAPKLIFNVGAITVNSMVIGAFFHLLYEPAAPLLGSAQNLLALATLGVGDVLVNGLLISMVIALATGSPIAFVWAQNFRPHILHDVTMLPLAVFAYILWQYNPWSVALVALPLLVMHHSYQLVADLSRQTREALAALARVLDERDGNTGEHSKLVAENAGRIARQLGLGAAEVEVIMRAAALHDIGKVGMRNDVLFKPAALTPEERAHAQRHAVIGGELLSKFPLFEKGAVLVRHHHERWDGKGYPDGLAGEAIPFGARILAVADSYQAMTENRPYRNRLTPEEALTQLRAGAGTQFDPRVVEAFLALQGEPFMPGQETRLGRTEQITAS